MKFVAINVNRAQKKVLLALSTRSGRLPGLLNKHILKLAVVNSIGMFLVVLMGALVTNTQSGRGCGEDWPLCNGKFVPAYTVESMIEWSHRFVTGIVGIIVLVTLVAVLAFVRRRDAKWYAWLVLFFTLLQAMLGAMAVMWPQASGVLALHFGISLLAFAFTALLVMVLREDQLLGRSSSTNPTIQAFISGRFRVAVWLVFIYCYVVVYIGAFVRHTKSSGGCGTSWPLCNGTIIPELSGAGGIMFAHRIAAIVFLVILIWLFAASRTTGQSVHVQHISRLSLFLVVLQIFSGAFVTYAMGSDWYLLASLIHTVLISGLFSALLYLCVLTLRPGPSHQA